MMKQRWIENRDRMLEITYAGQAKLRGMPNRYRRIFNKLQKQMWQDTACVWCKSTENLVLDHIVPASCGGQNVKRNAQTLCAACNLWKMFFVDRPLLMAGATYKGG